MIKLRCWLYYKVIANEISIRWIKLETAINEALKRGDITRYEKWLTLKEFGQEEIKIVYEQKKRIGDMWSSIAATTGYWFEEIVRDAFQEEGWEVLKKAASFNWDGQEIEIDVYCLAPVHLGVEVKNKSSDVYHSPTIIHPDFRNDDHEQILKMFKFCKNRGITPVLMASFIDKSFQGFAYKYKGLYLQTLFQFFKKKNSSLVNQIKKSDFKKGFYFGNVKAINRIPEYLRLHIRAIPAQIKRLY